MASGFVRSVVVSGGGRAMRRVAGNLLSALGFIMVALGVAAFLWLRAQEASDVGFHCGDDDRRRFLAPFWGWTSAVPAGELAHVGNVRAGVGVALCGPRLAAPWGRWPLVALGMERSGRACLTLSLPQASSCWESGSRGRPFVVEQGIRVVMWLPRLAYLTPPHPHHPTWANTTNRTRKQRERHAEG